MTTLNRITVILFCIFLSPAIFAADPLPDDIRYMLEDLYGTNKNNWPRTEKKDLNNDGFPDWVAKRESCKGMKKCPIEIFICVPDKKGNCSEYCYNEVKTLEMIKAKIAGNKCEATC